MLSSQPKYIIYFWFFVQEHTGRMCTRSLRCPQHTDSQRKNVRQVMLESHAESDGHILPAIGDKEKEMIDVDTWEEGDSLASLLTAQVGGNYLILSFDLDLMVPVGINANVVAQERSKLTF